MRWSVLPTLLLGITWSGVFAQTSVDTYLTKENPIAKAGLLANIGPDGAQDQGAKAGIVIASPSTNPDYIYTWTRDSSLVFRCLIEQ
jgi:glucoamylase